MKFENIRNSGKLCINLNDNDEVIVKSKEKAFKAFIKVSDNG
mgnify:CR=1 FL=1